MAPSAGHCELRGTACVLLLLHVLLHGWLHWVPPPPQLLPLLLGIRCLMLPLPLPLLSLPLLLQLLPLMMVMLLTCPAVHEHPSWESLWLGAPCVCCTAVCLAVPASAAWIQAMVRRRRLRQQRSRQRRHATCIERRACSDASACPWLLHPCRCTQTQRWLPSPCAAHGSRPLAGAGCSTRVRRAEPSETCDWWVGRASGKGFRVRWRHTNDKAWTG